MKNSLQSYIFRKTSEEKVRNYIKENGFENNYSLDYACALAADDIIKGYDFDFESNTGAGEKLQFTIRYIFPDTIIPLKKDFLAVS